MYDNSGDRNLFQVNTNEHNHDKVTYMYHEFCLTADDFDSIGLTLIGEDRTPHLGGLPALKILEG